MISSDPSESSISKSFSSKNRPSDIRNGTNKAINKGNRISYLPCFSVYVIGRKPGKYKIRPEAKKDSRCMVEAMIFAKEILSLSGASSVSNDRICSYFSSFATVKG